MYKNLPIQELGRVLNLMQRRKSKFLLNLMSAVVSITTMVVLSSLTSKKMVNGVIYGQRELMFQAVYLALTGIGLVCFVTPITSYLATRYGKETILEIRSNLFNHVLQLPKDYFHQHSSGEILSRLTNDLNKFASIYEGELYVVLESFAIGSASVAMTFLLDWRLALVSLLLGFATFSVNTLYAKPIREISQNVQGRLGQSTQKFLDLVMGNRVLKLFNIDQLIIGKFSQENTRLTEANLRLASKEGERDGVNYFLDGAYSLGILGAGGLLVSRGLTDMGTVVAVLTLRLGVGDLFTKFGRSLTDLQKSLAGVQRVMELIDESEESLQEEIYQIRQVEPTENTALFLDQVQFSYDGVHKVIDGLNLRIEQEQMVALVGPSGAGKSTIAKLLLGLYTPHSGQIILTDSSGELKNLEDWRTQFAYVSQDAYLFDTTIGENIRYGHPTATQAEIIRAAQQANVHDFIESLPQGYNTRVGENSAHLSGGQRQRIAIARALLKDAPFLLLDEATSALDSESERLVQDALDQVMAGRTVIVIAHRLSTIQKADQVYVIEGGRVVKTGDYSELVTTFNEMVN